MGITIASPTPPTIRREYAPIVFTRAGWGDDWWFEPELVPTAISVCSASHGVSSCTLARHYGSTKEPWQSSLSQKYPWAGGAGRWVMVALCDGAGYEPVFHGRISADSRELYGDDNGAAGVQAWSARGPLDLLRQICVSQSTWAVNHVTKTLDWIPSLNLHDGSGTIRGNRSITTYAGANNWSYHYGGDREWNYEQYLNYILAQFVNGDPTDTDTPIWTLGGMSSLLANLKEPVKFGTTQTVAEILAKLVPRSRGLDYSVVTTDSGFEICVWPLNSKATTFGSTTLPSNPYVIDFYAGGSNPGYSVRVAESKDEQYGKIRVLGKRLVVCCSLNADGTALAEYTGETSLQAGWASASQSEYTNCNELDILPETNYSEQIDLFKKYRRQDRFRTVYRVFTASDDFLDGASRVTPTIDATGEITESGRGDHQYKILKTLDWVPLYENVVYGEQEAQDVTLDMYANEDGETQPELLPPMAWIGPDSDNQPEEDELMDYRPVEKIGANVSALKNHFGLFIETTPNHLLADALPAYTNTEAVYDHGTMIITAAFETDQRLRMERDIPGGDTTRVKEIEVDAEAWWMQPNTVVGLDPDNQPIRTMFQRELRNDNAKMEAAMTAAIVRYGNPRSRATIGFEGIALWGGLIGCVLGTVMSGGVPHTIQAPITNVSWALPALDADDDGQATTTVHTGYAR